MLIMGSKAVGAGNVQAEADEIILQGALTAATGTAVGGVLKLKNDFGIDLIVTDVFIDIKTKSAAAAATIDMGVDDGGDTSSDNLLDGLAMGTATGVFCNRRNAGTNGGCAVWKKDEYIVATASGTLAGLVGTYTIKATPRL